jgi:hypothetical protein
MQPFERQANVIAKQMAEWAGKERRNASAFTESYRKQFPERRGATVICSQCGSHQSGPKTIPAGAVIIWKVCPDCQSSAAARLTDTENRNAYGYQEPERYPVGAALLIAGACASIFWGVIYLIISGGQ